MLRTVSRKQQVWCNNSKTRARGVSDAKHLKSGAEHNGRETRTSHTDEPHGGGRKTECHVRRFNSFIIGFCSSVCGQTSSSLLTISLFTFTSMYLAEAFNQSDSQEDD